MADSFDSIAGDNRFYTMDYGQRADIASRYYDKADERFGQFSAPEKQQIIDKTLDKYNAGKHFDTIVDSIVHQESGGDPNAVGKAGEIGLMQIKPSTAKDYGITDAEQLKDPATNLKVGRQYLADMIKKYPGSMERALYAYNAGQGNVDKGNIPDSTKAYATSILSRADQHRDAQAAAKAAPSGMAETLGQYIPAVGGTVVGTGVSLGLGPELGIPAGYAATKGITKLEEMAGMAPKGASDLRASDVPMMAAGAAGGAALAPLGTLASSAGFGGATALAQEALNALQQGKDYQPPKGMEFLKDVGSNMLLDIVSRGAAAGTLKVAGIPGMVKESEVTSAKATEDLAPKLAGAREDVADASTKAQEGITEPLPEAKQLAIAKQAQEETTRVNQFQEQRAIQDTLGQTPNEAVAVKAITPDTITIAGRNGQEVTASPPSLEASLRRTDAKNAVFGPIRRMSDALGGMFEKRFEGAEQAQVDDVKPISDTIERLNTFAKEHAMPLSSQVNKLIADANQITGTKRDGLALLQASGLSSKEIDGLYKNPRQLDVYLKALNAREESNPANKVTIAKLLGLRSRASELMGSAGDPYDANAAWSLVHSIDSILPGADDLRSQYKTFRDAYRPQFMGQMSNTLEPSDMVPKLFGEEQRGMALWDSASASERSNLKQLFGNYVLDPRNGMTPDKIRTAFPSGILKRMGFSNDWITKSNAFDTVDNKLQTSTQAQNLYQKALAERYQQINQQAAKDMTQAVLRLQDKLGPEGRELKMKMNQAKSYQEAAKIADAELDRLEKDIPHRAAIEAISHVPSSQIDRMLKFRTMFHASSALGGLMMGSMPHYMIGAVTVDTALRAQRAPSKIFRKSLAANPAEAERMYAAAKRGDYRGLAYRVADSVAGLEANKDEGQQ